MIWFVKLNAFVNLCKLWRKEKQPLVIEWWFEFSLKGKKLKGRKVRWKLPPKGNMHD